MRRTMPLPPVRDAPYAVKKMTGRQQCRPAI
jgi:hypothetical protein